MSFRRLVHHPWLHGDDGRMHPLPAVGLGGNGLLFIDGAAETDKIVLGGLTPAPAAPYTGELIIGMSGFLRVEGGFDSQIGGANSTGVLTVGGELNAPETTFDVGENLGGPFGNFASGMITVDGGRMVAETLNIGKGDSAATTGTLDITNGGIVQAQNLSVATEGTRETTVGGVVIDGDSSLTIDNDVVVGAGGMGNFNLEASAQASIGGAFRVGTHNGLMNLGVGNAWIEGGLTAGEIDIGTSASTGRLVRRFQRRSAIWESQRRVLY